MKRLLIILVSLSILSGCKKDNTPRTSGIDTIENTLFGSGPYYANGFSFSQAKKISSLLNPWPDIVLYYIDENLNSRLTFQTENFQPSFYKLGDYPDAASAISAFNNLKTAGAFQGDEMADPVQDNQVWVYRTQNECYVKIRIVSTEIVKTVNPILGKCTFEWVYQPDGSLTFPGK